MMCGAIIVVAGTILFCIHNNNEDNHNRIVKIKRDKILNESCPHKFTSNKSLDKDESVSTNKSSTEKTQAISTKGEGFKCNEALDKQELFVNVDTFHSQLLYCPAQETEDMKQKALITLATKQLLDNPKNEISIVETVVEIKNNETTTTIIQESSENKNHHLQVFIQGYFDVLQRLLNMKGWYFQQAESSTILTAC